MKPGDIIDVVWAIDSGSPVWRLGAKINACDKQAVLVEFHEERWDGRATFLRKFDRCLVRESKLSDVLHDVKFESKAHHTKPIVGSLVLCARPHEIPGSPWEPHLVVRHTKKGIMCQSGLGKEAFRPWHKYLAVEE